MLLALPALLLAACGGGGNSSSSVVNQAITPCYGADLPTPNATPAFDVWQANFAPSTPIPTPSAPLGSPGPLTPTPTAGTPTPQGLLEVSVDTVNAASAAEFRLTVACQGTVVAETTGTSPAGTGMPCSFPPPSNGTSDTTPLCPSVMLYLSDFGFSDLRRLGCLIEIGPTQPLGIGVGMCADPTHADYRLTVTLDNIAPFSLILAAHNCRAPESCLQDVFGIDVGSSSSSN